jgi:hypothetical protein
VGRRRFSIFEYQPSGRKEERKEGGKKRRREGGKEGGKEGGREVLLGVHSMLLGEICRTQLVQRKLSHNLVRGKS